MCCTGSDATAMMGIRRIYVVNPSSLSSPVSSSGELHWVGSNHAEVKTFKIFGPQLSG